MVIYEVRIKKVTELSGHAGQTMTNTEGLGNVLFADLPDAEAYCKELEAQQLMTIIFPRVVLAKGSMSLNDVALSS
jgi:hypothetical protein